MITLSNDIHISSATAFKVLGEHALVLKTSNRSQAFDPKLRPLTTDNRTLPPGGILLVYRGVTFDPHELLAEDRSDVACTAGLIILEDSTALPINCTTPWIEVTDGRAAWSWLCSAAYGNPGSHLRLHGVTGTNGKTSTVWMAKELCRTSGLPYGTLGTLGAYIGEDQVAIQHTTPDPPYLFSFLRECHRRGVRDVFMEVSSHAISQKKIEPLKFSTLVFTSFSRDHLDFHGSLEAYFQAKWHFFSAMGLPKVKRFASAILRDQLQEATEKVAQTKTNFSFDKIVFYGPNGTADCRWQITSKIADQQVINLRYDGEWAVTGPAPYYGPAMLDNFSAANLIVNSLPTNFTHDQHSKSAPSPTLATEWLGLRPVPGRFETVTLKKTQNEPLVLVDYAHTPDALEQTLQVCRGFSTGCLWVVFGCGGDRDKGKRGAMGSVAVQLADHVIITSDNPRTEDPEAIMQDILVGAESTKSHIDNDVDNNMNSSSNLRSKVSSCSGKSLQTIQDRKQAIRYTMEIAAPKDTVLIAGKGHETYQIVGSEVLPFDDRLIAAEALAKRETP